MRAVGRTAELEAQTVWLQEANVALKVLLDNRDHERIAMQEETFGQSFAQHILADSPMAGSLMY